jgi:hypothetical protein
VRRGRALALVPGLLLLLGGCFTSRRPLGPREKGTLDDRLLATWTCIPPEKEAEGQQATLGVAAFDETQYILLWQERKDERPEYYRAYSSRVGAETLLNVKPLGTAVSGGVWSFVRYRVEADGRLRAWIVDEDAVGARGEAGLAVVRRRVAEERLYHDLMTCTRKE